MVSGSPNFPWRIRERRHRYRPFVPSQRIQGPQNHRRWSVSFLWLRPLTSSRTWSTRPLYKAYTCIHQLENNHLDYEAPSHTHADISDAGSLASLHSSVRRALPTQLGVSWQETVASVVRWGEVWNLPALGRVYGPQLCRSLVLVLVERAQPEQEHCWIHERELSSRFYLCRLCTAFYGRVLRAQTMGRNIPRIRCKVDQISYSCQCNFVGLRF